ncbi:Transposase, IS5 family OS=Singulisphaera acidiphila (strain ATCC BAA-1392 / DSM 18658 / VKM B-2454 / MOB10) GN=Sinac_2152 PE=4 SV=1 [Gemmataceae bacterium]|nr:Transposase, IS5 family OS=Singulisphaera acidiphila (strain ATCC BAA-1392 / DSM 18658 / VKM B-2454 / MOB10) GN=Sinac_2152 PE=4 SV=1 [Gemmataceae bacterium]VTU00911.1 Transposase, IS5 family OS=Singulisphaera acidiphila (strain ATCC BAA-1392 / DSM 18658 / VKM B-2454 / MOB10) GN=Sinac_2152 PE=4 SV=1 [Gemmataceae bacterium]
MAIRTAGANVSDHRLIIPLVAALPEVGGKPGRPKGSPDELHADRGFDSAATRRITPSKSSCLWRVNGWARISFRGLGPPDDLGDPLEVPQE